MKKSLFNSPQQNPEKGKTIKTVSWLVVAASILAIADQFLEWKIIDILLTILNGN